jgi:hypothetical protein
MFLTVSIVAIATYTGQPDAGGTQVTDCRYERYQRLAEKRYRKFLKQEKKLHSVSQIKRSRFKAGWYPLRKKGLPLKRKHVMRRADRCFKQ